MIPQKTLGSLHPPVITCYPLRPLGKTISVSALAFIIVAWILYNSGAQPFYPDSQMGGAQSVCEPDLASDPDLALRAGMVGLHLAVRSGLPSSDPAAQGEGSMATPWFQQRRVHSLIPTHHAGLGKLAVRKGDGINGYHSSTTKFPNLWGIPGARCHGFMGQIWLIGWTPLFYNISSWHFTFMKWIYGGHEYPLWCAHV